MKYILLPINCWVRPRHEKEGQLLKVGYHRLSPEGGKVCQLLGVLCLLSTIHKTQHWSNEGAFGLGTWSCQKNQESIWAIYDPYGWWIGFLLRLDGLTLLEKPFPDAFLCRVILAFRVTKEIGLKGSWLSCDIWSLLMQYITYLEVFSAIVKRCKSTKLR